MVTTNGQAGALKERGQLVALGIALALALAADVVAVVLDRWFEARAPASVIDFGLREGCYTGSNGTCHDLEAFLEHPPMTHFCPQHTAMAPTWSNSSTIDITDADVTKRITIALVLLIAASALLAVGIIVAVVVILKQQRPEYPTLILVAPVLTLVVNTVAVVLIGDLFSSWLFCGRDYCDLVESLQVALLDDGATTNSCSTTFKLSFVLAIVSDFITFVAVCQSFAVAAQLIWRKRKAAVSSTTAQLPRGMGRYQYYTKETPPTAALALHYDPNNNNVGDGDASRSNSPVFSNSDGDDNNNNVVTDPFGVQGEIEDEVGEQKSAKRTGRSGKSHSRTVSVDRKHKKTRSHGNEAPSSSTPPAEGEERPAGTGVKIPLPPPPGPTTTNGAPPPPPPPPTAAAATADLPPDGDWYHDPTCDMYYCRISKLYFDIQTQRYYSVDTGLWLDRFAPEKGWYQ